MTADPFCHDPACEECARARAAIAANEPTMHAWEWRAFYADLLGPVEDEPEDLEGSSQWGDVER